MSLPSTSTSTINHTPIQQKLQHLSLGTLCKSIAYSGLFLFLFYTFFYSHENNHSSDLFMSFFQNKLIANYSTSPSNNNNISTINSPTNVSHIMFVIAGSIPTWKWRKPYIEAWWRENVTRGKLWLDEAPTGEFLPWPSSSPPFRVNEDVTKIDKFPPNLVSPVQVRMFRSILETFRLGDNEGVRWYVMVDDDTLVFVDNFVQVLGKYDHSEYYYIGRNSECIDSNHQFSFDMGYGGAGYALSYGLVEVLASKLDECVQRYQHLYVSDYVSHSCLADLGVDLTMEKGIHQIDLHGDISGLLSSHPKSPVLTLHHFDTIDPIFPSKDRSESINHLMKAANTDQSRLLQQTICHHRESNWTFSVSWGYSINIYENIFPRSFLRKPLETFRPWRKGRPPFFMFNTRWVNNDPCEAPHEFFLQMVNSTSEGDDQVVTTYVRSSPRNLLPCLSSGNHSADPISRIKVFSPATRRKEMERLECCDVEYVGGNEIVDVKLRSCMEGEMVA